MRHLNAPYDGRTGVPRHQVPQTTPVKNFVFVFHFTLLGSQQTINKIATAQLLYTQTQWRNSMSPIALKKCADSLLTCFLRKVWQYGSSYPPEMAVHAIRIVRFHGSGVNAALFDRGLRSIILALIRWLAVIDWAIKARRLSILFIKQGAYVRNNSRHLVFEASSSISYDVTTVIPVWFWRIDKRIYVTFQYTIRGKFRLLSLWTIKQNPFYHDSRIPHTTTFANVFSFFYWSDLGTTMKPFVIYASLRCHRKYPRT